MPKCDPFSPVNLYPFSPVYLLHIFFRTPFPRSTSGCVLLDDRFSCKNSWKIKVLSLCLDKGRNLNVHKMFR